MNCLNCDEIVTLYFCKTRILSTKLCRPTNKRSKFDTQMPKLYYALSQDLPKFDKKE